MPFGDQQVLRNVNLDIYQGDFIAITGPSGSGKSTLLNLAALLDSPTSGELKFFNNNVNYLTEDDLSDIRKNQISMVFQNYNLLPRRSVLENVMFRFRYLESDPKNAEARSRQALEHLNLETISDKSVRLLSGGEMQRVAIARAVANSPKLLVADEPTGNLDSSTTKLVMESFARLNQTGITILLVTHNENLLDYCSRHITCRDSKLYEEAA
jgi:putative ABC transport system ATP-binding protein